MTEPSSSATSPMFARLTWQGLLRSALAILTLVALSSCLDVQLHGPVVNGAITIAPLREPDTILLRGDSRDIADVIDDIGQQRWDRASRRTQMFMLGTADMDMESLDDETLYLVKVSGGADRDFDHDMSIDDQASAISADLHAIMSGAQLKHLYHARVSALTDAAYRWIEPDLDELTDQQVRVRLRRGAEMCLADSPEDPSYDNLLAWTRKLRAAETYRWDIANVDRYADAVLSGAPEEELRSLADIVIEGDSDGDGISNGSERDDDNDGIPDSEDSNPSQGDRQGRFIDAAVANLGFRSDPLEGRTGSNGEFQYLEGQPVEFSIGALTLGASEPGVLLSPINLFPDAFSSRDGRVSNTIRLLQALDEDCAPDNGIVLTDALHEAAAELTTPLPELVFEFEASEQVQTLLDASDCTDRLVDAELAHARYLQALEDEYRAIFEQVGSFSTEDNGTLDALVGADGSLASVRTADAGTGTFLELVFVQGDDTIVIGVTVEGLPTRMVSSDGVITVFTNHTSTSVDTFTETERDDIERVQLTPEAIAAYAALRRLFLDGQLGTTRHGEPLRQLHQRADPVAGAVTGAAGTGPSALASLAESIRDWLISPARAQTLTGSGFLLKMTDAVFSYTRNWDESRDRGDSSVFRRVQDSLVLQVARQASQHNLPTQTDPLTALSIARAGGLCSPPSSTPGEESVACGGEVGSSVNSQISSAQTIWAARDEPALRQAVRDELRDAPGPNNPPQALIYTPDDGSVFPPQTAIGFSGECADIENNAERLGITWFIDGEEVASGVSNFVQTLPNGDHKVRLLCTDLDGAETYTQVIVRVTPPPVINSMDVPELVEIGSLVDLSVDAENANGSPIAGDSLVWSSDREGLIGQGQNVDFQPTVPGNHLITVSVTGAGGAFISMSAPMTVCDPCGGPPADGEYLVFKEGSPAAPGDRLTIEPAGGDVPDEFELVSPIPVSSYTEGFTLNLFAGSPDEFELVFGDSRNLSDQSCRYRRTYSSGNASNVMEIVESSVSGHAIYVEYAEMMRAVNQLQSQNCGNGDIARLRFMGVKLRDSLSQIFRIDSASLTTGQREPEFNLNIYSGDWYITHYISPTVETTGSCLSIFSDEIGFPPVFNAILSVTGANLRISYPRLNGTFTANNIAIFNGQVSPDAGGISHAPFGLLFSNPGNFATTETRIEFLAYECVFNSFYVGERAFNHPDNF